MYREIDDKEKQATPTPTTVKTEANKLGDAKQTVITSTSTTGTPTKDRSVPIHELILSISSINLSNNKENNSLMHRDSNGNIYTNLNIQEPDSIEVQADHVKYINIFSILCCFCFPLTGIISIIFARLTKKYYTSKDMIRAKYYLNKAEWMLLLTFFCGLTIIGVVLGFLEAFWFKSNSSAPAGLYRSTSFPK